MKHNETFKSLSTLVFWWALLLISNCPTGFAIRCVQCDSAEDAGCVADPPEPMDCPDQKNMRFCIIVEEKTTKGELLRLTRTCSPADILTEECEDGKVEDGATVIVCHRACDTDGCNSAPMTGHSSLGLSIFLLLLLVLLLREST